MYNPHRLQRSLLFFRLQLERKKMAFKTKDVLNGKVAVIECPERLDASLAEAFRKGMTDMVEKGQYRLVLDFSNTVFMDSSGLGAIVSKIATARSNQGDIRLACPNEFVLKLLGITHLDKVLQSFETVESATNSFDI
jgi:anti-sigma B factor antagonist